MNIEELIDNGIVIYKDKKNIIVEKKETTLNKRTFEKQTFKTLQASLEFIEGFLKIKEWRTIVRYNRGLGIEYKNLKVINALSFEEAKIIAKRDAENLLGDSIIEIKVLENF